jgi:hypothetical protein
MVIISIDKSTTGVIGKTNVRNPNHNNCHFGLSRIKPHLLDAPTYNPISPNVVPTVDICCEFSCWQLIGCKFQGTGTRLKLDKTSSTPGIVTIRKFPLAANSIDG